VDARIKAKDVLSHKKKIASVFAIHMVVGDPSTE
jgi:hypothetical protein